MKTWKSRTVGAPGPSPGIAERGFSAPHFESPGSVLPDTRGHSFGEVSVVGQTTQLMPDRPDATLQLKLITDETALGVFKKLLERSSSTADSAPGHHVLAGVNSLPNDLKADVNKTIASVGAVCATLRGNNPPDFWETKYYDTWRSGHRNDGGWLAAHDIDVVDTGDAARNAYWAASESRYIELTITGTWRLLWDVSTNVVYLTPHYEDDGSHSPFFLLTGLSF